MHIIIKKPEEERNREKQARDILNGYKREEERGKFKDMTRRQADVIKDAWKTFPNDPRL
jgi:hypothetical protein